MSPRAHVQTPHSGRGKQRLKRLLNQADKDPSTVLNDRRCLKPRFCEAFFERCHGKALEEPKAAPEYAEVAVELAKKTGDRHLINLSLGVRVHAHIANQEYEEADRVLESYQAEALGCCGTCTADFFLRRGDLQVETGEPFGAEADLLLSIEELGDDMDADTFARIRFIRGIMYYHRSDPERALNDAGKALLELALEAPRGYFMDTLAFIACFLREGERCHDELARDYLDRFHERIKGVRDWADVRTRWAWVKAVVCARLGETRQAYDQFEIARAALTKSGPAKQAVAVHLDEAILLARRLHDNNLGAVRNLISECLRKVELDEYLRRRLAKIQDQLSRTPETVFGALDRLRAAIVVPVPRRL